MSASVAFCIARIASPLRKTPSTTRMYAMTPRYWSNSESKIRARAGASGSPGRRRHARDELLEHVDHALPRLARDVADVLLRLADELGHLGADLVGHRARQVDLVQARDELEAGVDGQVGVGDRLRLDALGGVHHEQRALARRQAAADLVREVDVPGRVDEVQLVGLAVARLVEDAYRLRLDRDAALALEVHGVEQLLAHHPGIDRLGHLQDAVGQRRLAVVDVGDDGEVPDVRLVCHVRQSNLGVPEAGPRTAAPRRP